MAYAKPARVLPGKSTSGRFAGKVNTESDLDLSDPLDDISAREKMKSLIRSTPISTLSESLNKLDTKNSRTAAENSLLGELQAAHSARVLGLVAKEDSGALMEDKDRLQAAPRPLSRSDKNLYWAIAEELDHRVRNK